METLQIYHEYLGGLIAGDRRLALDVVDRARAGGSTTAELYLEVFQPALREVGRLWERNRFTVAQEHLATAITHTAMLRAYLSIDLPARGFPLLIGACVDGERHEIGLRMLCDLLDLDGWETVYLGASVPAPDLVRMVEARPPATVGLSASTTVSLPAIRETIARIRGTSGGDEVVVIVGGRPFHARPDLATRLGADLTAADAAAAVRDLGKRFS